MAVFSAAVARPYLSSILRHLSHLIFEPRFLDWYRIEGRSGGIWQDVLFKMQITSFGFRGDCCRSSAVFRRLPLPFISKLPRATSRQFHCISSIRRTPRKFKVEFPESSGALLAPIDGAPIQLLPLACPWAPVQSLMLFRWSLNSKANPLRARDSESITYAQPRT